jgi:ClpP class serine protease
MATRFYFNDWRPRAALSVAFFRSCDTPLMRADYVSKILGTVWDLPKLRARTMIANMATKLLRDERPAESAFGDALPKMRVVGNVAIIPIRGIISMNVPDWIKAYGFNVTDANDIEEEINSALSNQNVDLIVFDVDSPGGWDLASVKLFEIVEVAARKKTVLRILPGRGRHGQRRLLRGRGL